MSKIFEKLPLSIEEQIQWLQDKNLKFDEVEISKVTYFLTWVNLFRLKPYLQYFQHNGQFCAGVKFSEIIRLYDFDRQLRLLMMDAIERIEVAIRSIINQYMMSQYKDTHWYLQVNYFNKKYQHSSLIKKITELQDAEIVKYTKECAILNKSNKSAEEKEILKRHRAKENYSRFYAVTYCEPKLMPSWAMLEELTMGDLSFLYAGLVDSDKKAIAKRLDLPAFSLLQSWLHTITIIRNTCAHHGRLWNRELGISPELPKNPLIPWTTKPLNKNRKVYIVFIIVHYLLHKINPKNDWSDRLSNCLEEFPQYLMMMGIPKDWQEDFKI